MKNDRSIYEVGSKPFSSLVGIEQFGFVVTGAGGTSKDWIDGLSNAFKKAGIASSDKPCDLFSEVFLLSGNVNGENGRTDLVFLTKPGAKLNIAILAMWRLQNLDGSIKWIDDFVDGYGGDYIG